MRRLTMRQHEKYKAAVLRELRETDSVSEGQLVEMLVAMPGRLAPFAFLEQLAMNGYIEQCIVGFGGNTVGYRLKEKKA
jgi:hypothetical protein